MLEDMKHLSRKKVRISSSVSKGLKKEVEKFSEKRNVSMSKYTEQAIKDKITRDREAFKRIKIKTRK